jgi:hypothetical protein
MNDKSAHEGLSLGYRFSYRIRHLMLSIFGPAQLGDEDPTARLEHERDEKIAEARRHHDRPAA